MLTPLIFPSFFLSTNPGLNAVFKIYNGLQQFTILRQRKGWVVHRQSCNSASMEVKILWRNGAY